MSENVLILSFLKKESNINRTFNVPNFTNRIPQGSGSRGTVGTYLSESLPNISGQFDSYSAKATGAFKALNALMGNLNAQVPYLYAKEFDASLSSEVYKDNAPVQPAATVVNFCIKY